jgi:hypothetical protein
MNAAAITDFAKLAADTLNTAFGSCVQFGTLWNGEPRMVRAVVSTGEPELNLEAGGFQKPVEFVLRVRKSDMSEAPEVKSAVVMDGKTYRVLSVREHFSPLAQEWILEVGTP